MDSFTQALLGAACGNLCARHKLGKRAARWGAIGGVLPDLDILAALAWGPWVEMRHHRGVTHSLWFGPVVGSAIGWLVWWRYARLRAASPEHEDAGLGAKDQLPWWMLVLAASIFTHPLLDVCTSYGTQIAAPFSDYRATINAIGVIDPVYSVPLVIALLVGKRDTRRKMRASAVALAFTTLYLGYGLWLNQRAIGLAQASLEAEGVRGAEVHAYPRVLQIFQRRLVARAEDQIYVGQVSMFAPRAIRWHAFRQDEDALVRRTRATPEGVLFEWFAMSQTAAHTERHGAETIVEIHDMRYGDVVEPELSMWGIRARYRDDGSLIAPIERFRRRQSGGIGAAFSRLMRDTFRPR